MTDVLNSNCRRCPDYKESRCDGKESSCICKFCPRNISMCIITKWCRETESEIFFESNKIED